MSPDACLLPDPPFFPAHPKWLAAKEKPKVGPQPAQKPAAYPEDSPVQSAGSDESLGSVYPKQALEHSIHTKPDPPPYPTQKTPPSKSTIPQGHSPPPLDLRALPPACESTTPHPFSQSPLPTPLDEAKSPPPHPRERVTHAFLSTPSNHDPSPPPTASAPPKSPQVDPTGARAHKSPQQSEFRDPSQSATPPPSSPPSRYASVVPTQTTATTTPPFFLQATSAKSPQTEFP